MYGQKSRLEGSEERISELGDRTIEVTEPEQQRGNRLKRNEQSLRDLWDYRKRSSICVIRSLEGEKREGLNNG